MVYALTVFPSRIKSRERMVGTVTRYTGWLTKETWFDSREKQAIFLLSKVSAPASGPTRLSVGRVRALEWAPCQADHSHVVGSLAVSGASPAARAFIVHTDLVYPCCMFWWSSLRGGSWTLECREWLKYECTSNKTHVHLREGSTCPVTGPRGPPSSNVGRGRNRPRGRGNVCCASRHAVAESCDLIKDICPELPSGRVVTCMRRWEGGG
jgi:hypothetical protein